MAIAVPKFVADAVSEFESSKKPFYDHHVADRIRAAVNSDEGISEEQKKAAWPELNAFEFRPSTPGQASLWGTYYRPWTSGQFEDGTPWYHPDIREVTPQVLEYWKKRSAETTHPQLKARYADLCWDLTKASTEQRPDVSDCRTAVLAYVEMIETGCYVHTMDSVHYAQRALNLAVSINDQGLIETVKISILKLLKQILVPNKIGTWSFLFDCLYENKRGSLTQADLDWLIESLEKILASCVQRGDLFDPHAAQAAAERLARHYSRVKKREEVERVIRAYGQAFEDISKDASPLLAMHWLQGIYEAYVSAGLHEDAKRVQLFSKQKAELAHQDFKVASATIEIPRDELKVWTEQMLRGELETVLDRVATHFTPNREKTRVYLEEIKDTFPLQGLFPISIVRDKQIIAQVGSIEEDPEGRLITHLAERIELEGLFLTILLEEMRKLPGLTAEGICAALFRSPVYEESHKRLIEEGVRAYMAGDLVKALHVFIPRIEAALRHLMRLLGEPTNKTRRSPYGVMQERTLNDVLEDPTVKALFGESIWLYLRTLLIDPRGHNVRNRLCHGLLVEDDFVQSLADRVFHVLLVLGLIRAK